jgi:hypothetical protein
MRTRETSLTCNKPMTECRASMLRLQRPALQGRGTSSQIKKARKSRREQYEEAKRREGGEGGIRK